MLSDRTSVAETKISNGYNGVQSIRNYCYHFYARRDATFIRNERLRFSQRHSYGEDRVIVLRVRN